MKKILFIFLLFALPVLSSAEISVNWLPQAGLSYTWRVTAYNKAFFDGSYMKFSPGFSAGAAAEVKFLNWLGVKGGLSAAQFVEHFYMPGNILSTPIYDSATGVTINALSAQNVTDKVAVTLPVLAVFYAGVTDYLDIYLGLGAAPTLITYQINDSRDANGAFISSGSTYLGEYYTGYAADLGLHWNAGPGRVTAGFTYLFYVMKTKAAKIYYTNNLGMYAGYLF